MKENANKIVRDLNGYRVAYLPNHPRAMSNSNWEGWVYEHIYVVEKYLGRSLHEDEVVHHLNGDRGNNRYSNLLVLTKAQHGRLHAWLAAGAPGIEKFLDADKSSLRAKIEPPEYCLICGLTLQDNQISTCSESCRGLSQRKTERPSKQQLSKDIQEESIVKVGAKYGVSDNAVRKWLKSYSLIR